MGIKLECHTSFEAGSNGVEKAKITKPEKTPGPAGYTPKVNHPRTHRGYSIGLEKRSRTTMSKTPGPGDLHQDVKKCVLLNGPKFGFGTSDNRIPVPAEARKVPGPGTYPI
jgi:hypothetical protein